MADRSLNRRNLDVAVTEWARLHGGSTGEQESLAQAGTIMMSIGQQLEDSPQDAVSSYSLSLETIAERVKSGSSE